MDSSVNSEASINSKHVRMNVKEIQDMEWCNKNKTKNENKNKNKNR